MTDEKERQRAAGRPGGQKDGEEECRPCERPPRNHPNEEGPAPGEIEAAMWILGEALL